MATTSPTPHINMKVGLVGFCPELTAGTPNYDFEASGGSGTTITVDASSGSGPDDLKLSGADDDFFNELLAIFKPDTTTSALRNKVYRVSDFAESGGTATLTVDETMAATPSSGDTFYLMGILKASNVSVTPDVENLTRDYVRQTLTPPSSLKGLAVASGSFGFELPGLETPSADGSSAGEDQMSQFLKCIGTRSSSAGEAVTGGSSTTTSVDLTDSSTFSVNQKVLINGEVRRVTAVDSSSTPNNITVAPALSAAPSASDVVYVGEHFTPDDGGQQTHTLLFLTDDRLVEVRGCAFNIKGGGEYGALLMGTAEFDGVIDTTNYGHQDGIAFNGVMFAKKAIPFKSTAGCYFGTTPLRVSSFEHDFGHGRQRLADTDQLSYDIRSAAPALNVNTRDVGKTPLTTWTGAGTVQSALIAVGNASGACVAFEGQAQVQASASRQNTNDTAYWQLPFGYVDDQEDDEINYKPQLVRF